MRVIFMGTPQFAVPVLKALVNAKHEVVAAYSQPPRAGGRRGKELTPSPVHMAAQNLGIEVRTPTTLRDLEAQADFAAHPSFQAQPKTAESRCAHWMAVLNGYN